MGMNVIGINTTGHEVTNFSKTYAMKDLDDVLPIADIVVNTLPETNETIHLLDRHEFEVMKGNVLFINVGRGTIVKENILIDALKHNQIRHACLDVFENEPLAPDNGLYHLDNVTITAHITGNGSENKIEVTEIFKKNLESILNKGNLIENEVNPDSGY